MSKNITKEELEILISKMEKLSERYIEAEKFIMELNFIERLFCSRKIRKFIKSRNKYNF